MVKIEFVLREDRIKIYSGNHVLYSDWCSLSDIINHIGCYEQESQDYHEKVKRARERLFARFGDCSFES